MSKASEVVAIAKSQLGYREKASNASLDDNTANAGSGNYTKYARDLHAAGYYNGNKNGYAWCDVFVDWCFYKAYGASEGQRIQCQTGNCGAGCTYSMQYYKDQGRLDKNPKVGDQIFFRYSGSSGADHTGLVVEVTGSQVVTIEGNSGDRVKQNTYSRGYSCIVGYGHPKFSETSSSTESTQISQTQSSAASTTACGNIIVGSKVEVKNDATNYYPGGPEIPGWVKSGYYHIVTQMVVNRASVTKGGKTCVLLGRKVPKNGGSEASGINTWIAIDYLNLISGGAVTETVYTVKDGDCLWTIAQEQLGSGARYTEIVEMNGLKTSVLRAGQQLKIPTK